MTRTELIATLNLLGAKEKNKLEFKIHTNISIHIIIISIYYNAASYRDTLYTKSSFNELIKRLTRAISYDNNVYTQTY